MRPICVLFVALSLLASVASSAPAPPLESLLRRADSVILARVIDVDGHNITFECIEALRGKSEPKFTLSASVEDDANVDFDIGSAFLLISQVEAKSGTTRPVLGRTMDGQSRWCGWIPLPARQLDQWDVERIWSFKEPSLDGRLSLAQIRRVITISPYIRATGPNPSMLTSSRTAFTFQDD